MADGGLFEQCKMRYLFSHLMLTPSCVSGHQLECYLTPCGEIHCEYCSAMCQKILTSSPKKFPFALGIWIPNHGSLGPPESITNIAS